MSTIPAYHGTRAPASARVRRRWRRKERDAEAAAAKKTTNAPSTTHDLAGRDMPASVAVEGACNQRPGLRVDRAAVLPTDKRHAHSAVRGHEHRLGKSSFKSDRPSSPPSPSASGELQSQKSHAQGHGLGHSQGRVPGHGIGSRDSAPNSNWHSMPPDSTKPTLSASCTSAEVVEALLPDHPVAANLLRRTASVYSSCERERMILRIRHKQSMDFHDAMMSLYHARRQGLA